MDEKPKIIRDIILLALAFVALILFFPGGAAHEILNGVFTGVAVLIAVLYRHITVDTILGRGEYQRGQRMALSLALLWVALNIRTGQSILYRATDEQQWILNLPLGALVTYLVIIAGYLQITSPNFKRPGDVPMHGQSTGMIAFAVALGFAVSVGVIWLQRSSGLQ